MAVDTSGIPYPLRGVCYQPAPTDYNGNQGQGQKYFDTDFFNADFEGFWSAANGGRGDLTNMSDLAINFIHLYDWNPPPARDHTGFLTGCAQLGLYLAVPFNNSFCTNMSSWGPMPSMRRWKRSIPTTSPTFPSSCGRSPTNTTRLEVRRRSRSPRSRR